MIFFCNPKNLDETLNYIVAVYNCYVNFIATQKIYLVKLIKIFFVYSKKRYIMELISAREPYLKEDNIFR